tara:strand:+ start:623 stop:1684 length:1062 start_codon:yes stop_codon:yes gene_type:complete
MRIFKLFVPFMALALMGAGCLGLGSSSTNTTDGAVWKSSDAGLNWVQSIALPTTKGVSSLASVSVVDLAMDPQDHQTIYIGTGDNGLFFTYDSGISWQQPRESSLKRGYVRAVTIDPEDKCTIYALLSTQLTKSEDCGRTFDLEVYVEGRNNVSVTALAVDWFNPNVVWLGTSDGDILKSEDAGENWDTLYRASSMINQIMIDNNDSRIVLASTSRRGIRKTTDGGENWSDLQDVLKEFDSEANQINHISQDAIGSTYVMATDYTMFRSTDKGDTWIAMDLLTGAGEVNIPVVVVDPNDTDKIYYATTGTIYSTVDAGLNWQTRKSPTSRTPSTLMVDPEDGNILYLTGIASD